MVEGALDSIEVCGILDRTNENGQWNGYIGILSISSTHCANIRKRQGKI